MPGVGRHTLGAYFLFYSVLTILGECYESIPCSQLLMKKSNVLAPKFSLELQRRGALSGKHRR